ncbi:spore germination protein [Clostridium sp. CF011]|uniref:GerAB/ArcD/ProY family transporter n=1 Tax=Clostridium sp. CF011 TaxID=2843318 RepID=UPI001C0C7D28|nr:endospore germination permease [Clostridium sp. CF011]MBU3092587.1 spore germination protein [Clostridium sp. CF011]WAG68716.1 spore germination protein [Clostridium sp. CF011]
MRDKKIIGDFGLFTTVVVAIVGVGIFSSPREVIDKVGSDAWIVTLAGGIVVFLLLYLMYMVMDKNDFEELTNILQNNFGKLLGGIFGITFAIYSIFIASLGMREFAEVIKLHLLRRTPTEFILMITILTGTYLVRGEICDLVKFNEIVFWIMFIPAFTVFILIAINADFTNLLPVLNNRPSDYFRASRYILFCFGGIEIAYLILPYVKNKSNSPRVLKKSIMFVTIFYLIVMILVLAVFSKSQSRILLWPTISMIRSLYIPGSFIERWEGIVMAFWIFFYFATFVNAYFFSGEIVKNVFKLKDIKLSSLLIMPIIYVVALYPQNIAELYALQFKTTPVILTAIFLFLLLPILILLVGKCKSKGKGGRKSADEI